MSLYTRPGSPYFYTSFEVQGHRVQRSTRQKTERKAQQVEDKFRAELLLSLQQATTGDGAQRIVQMSLDEACTRFAEEKVMNEAAADNALHDLNKLVTFFGADRLISTIGTAELIEFRQWRRATPVRGKLPAARTTNASIEVFRRMMKYADSVWSDERSKIATGPTRKWNEILLPVPKGRVRELKGDEEQRLFAVLRPDYHDIIQFAIQTGLRRAQLIVEWENVDLANGVLSYKRKSARENDYGILPLTDRISALIASQRGHSERYVFTYVSHQTKDGRIAGQRYPITYEGLGSIMAKAIKEAGLSNWRLLHDFRHTAASRVLRGSKDLKSVQAMLGHSDIASTMVYVHAMVDDVRSAMEKVSVFEKGVKVTTVTVDKPSEEPYWSG